MAVSSLKCCWNRFSARIRDYIDVVDSYYRPPDDSNDNTKFHEAGQQHGRRHHARCDRPNAKDKHAKSSYGHQTNHLHHRSRHHKFCTEYQSDKLHASSGQSQLPPGYSKRKTLDGQVYFVDSNGQKFWYDPSVPKELLTASLHLNLDKIVGRLSSNWEIKHTSVGKIYYVNHAKRTTQFTDPRLVAYKDELMNFLKQKNYTTPTSANSNSQNHHQINSPPLNIHGTASRRRLSPTSALIGGHEGRDLLRGSLHNLSTATNLTCNEYHSNTLTGRPPLECLRELTLGDARWKQVNQQIAPINACNYHQQQQQPQNDTITTVATASIFDSSSGAEANVTSTNSKLPRNRPHANTNYSGTTGNSSLLGVDRQSILPGFRGQAQAQHPRANKELFDKISILRQELLKQQVLAHPCRIDINRKRIFEESFRVVSQMQPRDLKKRLLVKFRGEEGLDYGGVAREWFYLLSRKILNPMHGLFQYTSDDIYNLQINPDSGIAYREHLSYLNFCGRIIGMAVFHGHFIEGHFTRPFYKMLLKKSINLGDIECVDPDLHRSLCWILENDITNVIDTTFLVQHNAFGQLQEHELKENGRNIVVTEENKDEYVSLYVNYRCRRGIESQFDALQRGFYELIQPNLVENFDEEELELLIGGLSKIDIEDWRIHTKLKNCNVESPLVRWFWDIVKSYDEDRRARLLQFVTGSPRVPIQGFKALQGVNSELRLFTIHLIRNACTDNLPKSHTCFNRIDLPPYENYEKLRDKLTQAIEETMGFAMQ